MASPSQQSVLAACDEAWVKGMSGVFQRLCEWQESTEPPLLYQNTLWSMMIAMGIADETLTAWTAFFDEDESDGTISVSPKLSPRRYVLTVTIHARLRNFWSGAHCAAALQPLQLLQANRCELHGACGTGRTLTTIIFVADAKCCHSPCVPS